MALRIGLDLGGTKIAGAIFDSHGQEIAQLTEATPAQYESLLALCRDIVARLERQSGAAASVGVCAPYADATANANMPFLIGKNLPQDLAATLNRPVACANDANCAALAEAREGAGRNHRAVFGLIMGTGIGGGFVLDGRVVAGANGLCGEIGHLPLPYYEDKDGERVACGCGQNGCIEKLIAGAALARRYLSLTGKNSDARQIAAAARAGETEALRVLDAYYTTVAKAMTVILHSFDPDIIAVSGGLNTLPALYDEIPKRWGAYALNRSPKTKFVPAAFGAIAGLRGAALLGQGG